MKVLSKTKSSIVAASAIAAFISVPAAALAFVIEYYLGGNATYDPMTVLSFCSWRSPTHRNR
jgi:hypothetical protein